MFSGEVFPVTVVQVVEGGFPSWSGPTTSLSLPPSTSHQHHLTHRDLAGGVWMLPPPSLPGGVRRLPPSLHPWCSQETPSLVQVCVLAWLPP